MSFIQSGKDTLVILRFCIVLIFSIVALFGTGHAAAAINDDDPQTVIAKARASVNAGRVDEAIVLYRRAVILLPTNADVRIELARLLTRKKETRAEAEKLYAEAVAIKGEDVNLAIERAANLVAVGDSVSAALEYRRAFELSPNNVSAVRGYVRQITRLGATSVAIEQNSKKIAGDSNDITSHLLLAELLRSEARYNEALDQYWLAQRKSPNNLVALLGTAETWLALGYTKRAEEIFTQVVVSGTTRGQDLANRARLFIANGNPDAARRTLSSSLTDVEKEPTALIALADTYRALKQTAQERAVLEKLLALFPNENVTALERLARIQFEMGDKKAAKATCQQLLQLDPSNAIGSFGLNLIQPSDSGETLSKESKETSPTRLAALNRAMGEAAMFWDKPSLAVPKFRSALEVWPDSPRLLLMLGSALLKTNDADGAVKAFAHVSVASGRRPDALLGWAQAEMLRQKPERSFSIYAEVLQLDPTNLSAALGQIEALQRMGDNARAAVLLSDLARREPQNGLVQSRLQESLTAIGRSYRASASSNASIEPLLSDGDGIRIRVAGHPELSAETNIDDAGLVRLSFTKSPIRARCLSARELSAEISKRSSEQIGGAVVEVSVTEYRRPSLVIAGAVHLPGSYQVRRTFDLLESLMLASGTNQRAGRTIYVVRGAKSCTHETTANSLELVETYDRRAVEQGRAKLTRPLEAGDAVIVPEATVAFITGAVARPSMIEVQERLSLLSVITRLGGTQPGAKRDNVRLLRLQPDGASRQQFFINLDSIEQKRVGDVILQPGDIVEIPSASGMDESRSFVALLQRLANGPQSSVSNSAVGTVVKAKP